MSGHAASLTQLAVVFPARWERVCLPLTRQSQSAASWSAKFDTRQGKSVCQAPTQL
jgi:hypothetical protein